jgi:hypothetical protein
VKYKDIHSQIEWRQDKVIRKLIKNLLWDKVFKCVADWYPIKYLYQCWNNKVNVKLSLCLTKHHAMKTYWENGCTAPRILDLGTRWMWVVSFTPRPLCPQGKSPRYQLDRRLGGPQSRSGGGDEKNFQPPPRIEPYNPNRPARSLVAIPSELSRPLLKHLIR